MREIRPYVILLVFICIAAAGFAQRPTSFDIILIHGHIVDGTGSPWYSGDVGIRDGKIAAIGNLSAATSKRTIDVHGMVVAPGFIDMLGQSEDTILVDPRLPSKIYQGITTEITGEGGSVAPLNDALVQANKTHYEHLKISPDWRTFREYFARLEKQGIGINVADYVGAMQVRRVVLGDADVQPTATQLEQMKALVRDAMHDGAIGVSTSLQYAPAPYAKTEELIALASEASKFGGIYATHMRSEGDAIMSSIEETLRISPVSVLFTCSVLMLMFFTKKVPFPSLLVTISATSTALLIAMPLALMLTSPICESWMSADIA